MTWLGVLNLILQLFFIRLTRVQECCSATLWEVSILPNGDYGAGFHQVERKQYWAIMYWVVPFTGWWGKFRYLGRYRQWQITSPKSVI